MATQIQTMSAPLALPNQSSGGSIITQIVRLFIQPKTFFRNMPTGSQWLFAVLLVLVITGFTATAQIQSSTASTTGTAAATTSTQTSSFNLSALSATSSTTAGSTTTAATTSTGTANTAAAATTTAAVSSDTTLMTGLLAVCGVLVMWAGQTTALSLVTMLRGYAPQVGKCLQIAVWASLPLALMLVLRYAHFASGGSGGSLGISLLLTSWSGYSTLPTIVQRILAVFTSNFTLFWLWNLLLIYLGARFALGGRRIAVALIVAIWIVAATIVPALATTPQTRTLPRQTTTTTTQAGSTRTNTGTATTGTAATTGTTGTTGTTATTQQAQGGFPGGGQPPTGGGPGG